MRLGPSHEKNIAYKHNESGDMIYLHPAPLAHMKHDLATFDDQGRPQ